MIHENEGRIGDGLEANPWRFMIVAGGALVSQGKRVIRRQGQEKLFMEAISTETLGEISWLGEDGETWQTTFRGNLVVEEGESYLVDAPTATYQPLIP